MELTKKAEYLIREAIGLEERDYINILGTGLLTTGEINVLKYTKKENKTEIVFRTIVNFINCYLWVHKEYKKYRVVFADNPLQVVEWEEML